MLTHKQLRAKALRGREVQAEFKKAAEEFALLDAEIKGVRAERRARHPQ